MNYRNLVLFMVQHILTENIQFRKLFQTRFWKVELMKLLEFLNMNDIKEQWEVQSIILFDNEIRSRVGVHEQVTEELLKGVNKKLKIRKVSARFNDNI